jgi:hypothetical protein
MGRPSGQDFLGQLIMLRYVRVLYEALWDNLLFPRLFVRMSEGTGNPGIWIAGLCATAELVEVICPLQGLIHKFPVDINRSN